MDLRKLERDNAREWDSESALEAAPSEISIDRPPPSVNFANISSIAGPRAQHNTGGRGRGNNTVARGRGSNHVARGRGFSPAPRGKEDFLSPETKRGRGNGPLDANASPSTPGRAGLGRGSQSHNLHRGSPRQFLPRTPRTQARSTAGAGAGVKTEWAEGLTLITTRQAIAQSETNTRLQEEYQYLAAPDPEEEFPIIGYYLWPSNDESECATEVLGERLSQLDTVRIEEKVFVTQMPTSKALKTCCRAVPDAQDRVFKVIEEIRKGIRKFNLKEFEALSVYIAFPPHRSALTNIIKPASVVGDEFPFRCSGIHLVDGKPTEEAMQIWNNGRPQIVDAYVSNLTTAATSALRVLSAEDRWMEMRVTFGHVTLLQSMKKFRSGKIGWGKFSEMISSTQMHGEMNPKFAPRVALILLRKLLQHEKLFKPQDGRYAVQSRDRIPFRETELVFFKDRDQKCYRIEADLDRLEDTDAIEYQVGRIRCFTDKKGVKPRMVITTVDAEKGLDWDLKISSDQEIHSDLLPPQITLMIQNSVDTDTKVFMDRLDLEYPDVTVKGHVGGVILTAVVVKSSVKFVVKDSGYVVEIALYRCQNMEQNITECYSGVTLYHILWDDEMRDIQGTTQTRGWEDPVTTFFGTSPEEKKGGHDIIPGERRGVPQFLESIEVVQRLLKVAIDEASAMERRQTAGAAQDDPEGIDPTEAGPQGETSQAPSSFVNPSTAAKTSVVDHTVEEDIYSADG